MLSPELCRGRRGLNVSDVVPRSFDDRMPAGRLTTDPPGVLCEPQRPTCEQEPGSSAGRAGVPRRELRRGRYQIFGILKMLA